MKNSIKKTAIAVTTLLAATFATVNTASAGSSKKNFLRGLAAVAVIGAIANSNNNYNQGYNDGYHQNYNDNYQYDHGYSEHTNEVYESESYNY